MNGTCFNPMSAAALFPCRSVLINSFFPGAIDERAMNAEDAAMSRAEREENLRLCVSTAHSLGCGGAAVGTASIADLAAGKVRAGDGHMERYMRGRRMYGAT